VNPAVPAAAPAVSSCVKGSGVASVRWSQVATSNNPSVLAKALNACGRLAEYEEQVDTAAREAYRAKIERAAQEAAGGSHHADLSDTHRAVGTP
jgi:hypothetical protein